MPLQRRTLGGDSTRGCQTEGGQTDNNPPHMRTLIRGNAALDNSWHLADGGISAPDLLHLERKDAIGAAGLLIIVDGSALGRT